MASPICPEFTAQIRDLGRREKAAVDASDVAVLKRQMSLSDTAQAVGRLCLHLGTGPIAWAAGTFSLVLHFALDSQFMHSIMHGAYTGLPGASRFTPERFETLAVPLQCKTWGQAHEIHHKRPSILGEDPDTLHPLYRVHPEQAWRPWHLLNPILAPLFVFENCIVNYDRVLKRNGLRAPDDRSELRKLTLFIAYQFLLFPALAALAGRSWLPVLLCTLTAHLVRNLIVSGLQMASSIGRDVSTLHGHAGEFATQGEWVRFQVETSKNYRASPFWRALLGGLDRHIEHHLFPYLPPGRLHAASEPVRELCVRHGVRYAEFSSFAASVRESLAYLASLARRGN